MNLTPVLVEVHGLDVSVCTLALLPGGAVALDSTKTFRPAGKVFHMPEVDDEGRPIKVKWGWTWDKFVGTAPTKREAIRDMLATQGFRQAHLESTIPDLLDGLTD